jgi:hypothetical protein
VKAAPVNRVVAPASNRAANRHEVGKSERDMLAKVARARAARTMQSAARENTVEGDEE